MTDVIIIGSGPAGLTAAIYCSRAGLKPLVLGGLEVGGQLMTTTLVENFPGFPEGVDGPMLMQNMLTQATRLGANIIYEKAEKVDFKSDPKKVWAGGKEYEAKAVIIATGASSRKLNLESEAKYWGKGVSSCATCDGAFYKEKTVAVIGGGDCAIEEATFLTRFASKVYLIHRRDSFRASEILQQRIAKNNKITVIWDTEVRQVLGDTKVNGLKLFNIKENKESELAVDGMFLAIGHIPNTAIFKGILPLDEEGYLIVKDNTRTEIAGVFAAGDVKDHSYRQAVTAAGMGCMAALDCEKWLADSGI
jgi:thioredoxin reductase (NADPH)